jgi:hypothetical protein
MPSTFRWARFTALAAAAALAAGLVATLIHGMDPKSLALALLHEGPMVISSLGLLLLAAAGPLSRQHSSPAR